MTWNYTTTSTNTGFVYYPVVTSGSTLSMGTTYLPTPMSLPAPKPKPAGPLEWLDAEVEKTCALARLAA